MEIEVGKARHGQRLDVIMANEGGMSRRQARRLIEAGSVFVDAKRTRVQSRMVDAGASIKWSDAPIAAPPPPVSVIRQGHDFVFVNKPAGMPTEPTRQASVGTLVETVRKSMREAGESTHAIAAVNRLDSDTTGVVLIATSPEAAAALSEPFRSGGVERGYLALVCGQLQDACIRIDAPIARGREPGRMIVADDGKPSVTLVTALAYLDDATLVSVVPQTGRTHQIRVHLAYAGHPILGDIRYGAGTFAGAEDASFCLHAHTLSLVDPRQEQTLNVCAPIPKALREAALSRGLPKAVLNHVALAPWERVPS